MDEMNTDGMITSKSRQKAMLFLPLETGQWLQVETSPSIQGYHSKNFTNYKSLDNKSDEINQKDERISRLEEQLLEVKSKLTDSEEKLKEAVHAAEETAKSIEEDGYTIDPQQEIILGSASWILGEYQQAEVYFKRAMLEFEKEDDQYMIGYTSNNIARIFQSLDYFPMP